MAHVAGRIGAVGLAAFTGEDGSIRREADRGERQQLCPRMGERDAGLQPVVGMTLVSASMSSLSTGILGIEAVMSIFGTLNSFFHSFCLTTAFKIIVEKIK